MTAILGPILGIGDPRTDSASISSAASGARRSSSGGWIRARWRSRCRCFRRRSSSSWRCRTRARSCRPRARGSSPSSAAGCLSMNLAGRPPGARMNVLIADKFEKVGVDGLKELGCSVISAAGRSRPRQLPDAIRAGGPGILIVRGTKVSAAALEAGPGLSLVIRAGAGIDTIDVAAASARGIFVSNCPGKNAHRGRRAGDRAPPGLRPAHPRPGGRPPRRASGHKGEYSRARGLHGRTLGIVGLGQIGREIASRARGVRHAGRRLVAEPDARRRRRDSASSTARPRSRWRGVSDAVSINVAATAETKHLVNAEFLAAMRPGRVSHQHLARLGGGRGGARGARSATKGIRAGLDVFAAEPAGASAEFTDPIVHEPGVYGTHHVGASTEQAQVAIAHEVLRIVGAFKETGEVPNCVNRLAPRARPQHVLVDPPPEPAGRAGARLPRAGRPAGERRGGREHHLSRRAGHPGPRASRQPAGRRGRRGDPRRQPATSSAWT